jgi:hypothetical protein
MSPRYPGYDVMAKRDTPSWNEQTREVIDARVAMDPERHAFLDDHEFGVLKAISARIVPQPSERPPQPVAAMVDEKLATNSLNGYRRAQLPPQREAWRRGLAAIDDEAQRRHGAGFAQLSARDQDELLSRLQNGDAVSPLWVGLPADLFFKVHVLNDIVSAYYALPCAWNEIGFGGPASPRGYVRLTYDRIDPWEAAEARPGREEEARRRNVRIG